MLVRLCMQYDVDRLDRPVYDDIARYLKSSGEFVPRITKADLVGTVTLGH
jgi:hypothetical protein